MCVGPPQKGIEDHFSARGKGGGKAFRGHFLEIWDHLVRETAASEVLFDGFVLSKLLDLVMAMAKCAPPGYGLKLWSMISRIGRSRLCTPYMCLNQKFAQQPSAAMTWSDN